jgi:hypothetical protein
MIIAIIMLIFSNSAFNDTSVVIVPAPAIIGKANGTILAVLPVTSSLNKRTPRIISKAIANKIKAPATANASMDTPNSFKILSPNIKNPSMIKNETVLVRAS